MRLHPLALRYAGSPSTQYVFIKKHENNSQLEQQHQHQEQQQQRRQQPGGAPQAALFVCGLPLHFGEAGLIRAFSCFGTVLQAVLHPLKRSGIVVLDGPEAVSAALAASKSANILELPDQPAPPEDQPVGLKAWVAAHKAARPGLEALQQQLDEWTEAHEAEEAAKRQAAQAAMAEDGWTVVVRAKGRKRTKESGGVTRQSGGVAQAAAQAMAEAKQAKPLEDFYKFQQREKRRSELLDLRKRFEEDRKRLAQLRATRNFRPV